MLNRCNPKRPLEKQFTNTYSNPNEYTLSALYPVSGNVFNLGSQQKQWKETWSNGHTFTDATYFRVSVSGAGAPPTTSAMNSNKLFYIRTDGTVAGTSVFFYTGSATDPQPYEPFYGDILFNVTDLKLYIYMRQNATPGWYKQDTAQVFS